MRGLLLGLIGVILAAAGAPDSASRMVVTRTFWPDGTLQAETRSIRAVLWGEYRTYYQSGAPYERRTFVDGREDGLQRSWTEDGTLFLNYEVRNGRRYGFVNARPCLPAGGGDS